MRRIAARLTPAPPREDGPAGAEENELRSALRALLSSLVMTGVFSAFVNVAMLTAPLYMLQVYDRVLRSRSESTLVALSILAASMLVVMGVLDWVRSRVLVRAGAKLDERVGERVFSAVFAQTLRAPSGPRSQYLLDLDGLRQFLTGPAPFALFDAPWLPFYLLVVALFHPLLGLIAAVGALILITIAVMNEWLTREPLEAANVDSIIASSFAESALRNAEVLDALGMMGGIRARWSGRHRRALARQALASDRAGTLAAASKATRMLLQIAILGTGAALAIQQIITPGAMIAASILGARALAPVEQAIANWRTFVLARSAYGRLQALLEENPASPPRMPLPAPKGHLSVERLVAAPPGAEKPVLRDVSFALEPGEALGVIGATASGKSTLARHLVGVWQPAHGSIRLDGASLADWNRVELGRYVGYLPQDVELFEGTVAENVCRFEDQPEPARVVRAASRAGAHEMILGLAKGYDTPIGVGGVRLSAGQRQRVGLARALYGDPVLVVLDEPNANLDVEGDMALTGAIYDLKQEGATVVVIAHRPAAIAAVDKILMLRDGVIAAFGPKDEVLTGPARVEARRDAARRAPRSA
jgi:PrtD family type I secretion system ABC transporter